MAALDTNILVRWLVGDDAKQLEQAEKLFRAAEARKEALFVPVTVALELEWVLRSVYGFDRNAIQGAFNALLECTAIEFQLEASLERALHQYRDATADFADCLHTGLSSAASRGPLLTFDARAARLTGAALLA